MEGRCIHFVVLFIYQSFIADHSTPGSVAQLLCNAPNPSRELSVAHLTFAFITGLPQPHC